MLIMHMSIIWSSLLLKTVIPIINLIHFVRLIADSLSTTLTAVIKLLFPIHGGSTKVDGLFFPFYCFRKEGFSLGPKYLNAWFNVFESLIK